MAENRVVPVIGVPDVEGSITRNLVAALHLMDLRIRSLNLIFPVRGREFLLERRAVRDLKITNAMREQILKAIFIPNQSLNKEYYLRSLEGMTMTILDATSRNLQHSSASGIIGEEQGKTLLERLRDTVSQPVRKYRIAIGRPHRLVQPNRESLPTSTNLVLLQITTAKTSAIAINGFRQTDPADEALATSEITITFNNTPKTFSLFSLPGLRDGDGDIQAQIKTNFAADQQTRLLAQWKEILGQINNEEAGDKTYLPVIFHDFVGGEEPATNFILEFASIGFSISLLDLGVFYSKYSGSNVDVTGGSSKMAQEHARGDAFDLSLVPYYAISGMVLKPHDPFILSQQFDPHNHHHPIFAFFPQITDFIKRSAYSSPLIKVMRQPSKIQENKQTVEDKAFVEANQDEIKLLIKSILGVGKVELNSEQIFDFEDLSEDDQHWYHQSVDKVDLPPPAKLKVPVPISRTGFVSSRDNS